MLNMREKSEMTSALSAQMCRLETRSRSVESEPENVLNTTSPSRCSSWISPREMTSTPHRPTTGGLQSPVRLPVQLGPSPLTQQYSRRSPVGIPPAQWGNHDAREAGDSGGEEECELFRDPPRAEFLRRSNSRCVRTGAWGGAPGRAKYCSNSRPFHVQRFERESPKRINGQLVRPDPLLDGLPSTACNASPVSHSIRRSATWQCRSTMFRSTSRNTSSSFERDATASTTSLVELQQQSSRSCSGPSTSMDTLKCKTQAPRRRSARWIKQWTQWARRRKSKQFSDSSRQCTLWKQRSGE